jgi:ATP-dependent DNA helicase RecG
MSNVQVRIFDDRIEVWGCGLLPEPLTIGDLKRKHESILRNPLIGKCFFLIKFIEQWGTGTNRMIEACLKHGLPEPEFELVAGSLVVIFWKDIYTEDYLRKMGLNEREIKAVMFVKKEEKITNKNYQELFGVSRQTATRELSNITQRGIFRQVGVRGKGTFYILAQMTHK